MDKIGAAIIGPGKVAHIHARAWAALPEARFVAVCGRNPERTQAFADQYGVRAYTNLTQMVNEPEVQLVLICTPHPQHAEQAEWRFVCHRDQSTCVECEGHYDSPKCVSVCPVECIVKG